MEKREGKDTMGEMKIGGWRKVGVRGLGKGWPRKEENAREIGRGVQREGEGIKEGREDERQYLVEW